MGTIFTLEPATLAIVRAALDDMITEFGKTCRLVYPPRWVACANCTTSRVGNMSSSTWRTGGPLPFPNGSACPLCDGHGRRAEEQSETLTLLCAYEPRGFLVPVPGLNVRAPDATLRTKCFLDQVPKLKKCEYLVYQTSHEGLLRNHFELASEPVDVSNIIKGRYAVAYWKQKLG